MVSSYSTVYWDPLFALDSSVILMHQLFLLLKLVCLNLMISSMFLDFSHNCRRIVTCFPVTTVHDRLVGMRLEKKC